ncbi:DUF6918 family protein [Microbacterium sp. Root53]|uniref:DUF6918 family protein n=1 Tax=Microbacterium sp. Root53 TaxID=1736553 RepID=UPI000ABAA906|nr:hypothetical protein [Microbacterium sp. Root53]
MTLSGTLLADSTRPAVIADLVRVVDAELADKKGLSGAAVKAAYSGVTKVVPDAVPKAAKRLLPDVARALDPFWADFRTSGGHDFGAYLAGRGDEASAALLAATDAKVGTTSRDVVQRTYRAFRGSAAAHVRAALPRLGAALQRHAS